MAALGIVAGLAIGAALAWAPLEVAFVLVGLVFLVLPFFNMEFSLYGMVALIFLPHFRLPVTDTFSISFSSLIMFSIAISLICRRIIRRESILGIEMRKFWPLWAFVLVHFLSLAASVNLTVSLGLIVHLFIWILLLIVTMQVIKTRRMLRNVLLLVVLEGLVITIIWAFLKMDQILSIQRYVGGIDYLYVHRGDYAFHVSVIIPFAIAYVIYERNGLARLMSIIASVVLIFSFVLTFSRAAWIGTIVGMTVYMRNWRAWVLGIITVIALLMMSPEATRERFTSIWDQTISTSNLERLLILNTGLKLATQHPILGVGTGNFETAMKNTRVSTLLPKKISAHNLYLEVTTETGFIGLFALLWFFFFIGKTIMGIRARGPDEGEARFYRLAFTALGVSLFVQYFAGVGLYSSLPWFFFGLIFAAHKLFNTDDNNADASATKLTAESSM